MSLFTKIAWSLRLPRRAGALLAMTIKRFAMTFSILTLAVILSFGIVSESRAIVCTSTGLGNNGIDENGHACESCGPNCNWSLDSDTKTVEVSGTSQNGGVIMNNYTGWTPWFKYADDYLDSYASVENVKISGISHIGNGAFFSSGYIKNVIFMDDILESIGEHAFHDNELTELKLPNSVKIISESAFETNYSLKTLELGDSIYEVAEGAFMDSPITTIIIPDTLNNIGDELSFGPSLQNVICRGENEKCAIIQEKFAEAGYDVQFSSANKDQCNSTMYYFNGKECIREPEISNRECVSGYVVWEGQCLDEYPFAKKHWTPAEANEWLNNDNNTVTITFKK